MTPDRTPPAASGGTPTDWILRSAAVAQLSVSTVDLTVTSLPAICLHGTPGWLTGEPLGEQGVEVHMPNLPNELPLPEPIPREFRCRVEVVGRRALRLTVAQPTAEVFDHDATWLGIVTQQEIDDATPSIETTDDAVVVDTGELRLEIGLQPFRVLLADRRRPLTRTAERLRQVAGFPMAPPIQYRQPTGQRGRMVLNLELGAHEEILGFGEQFCRVTKNGQHLTLRAEDALGTGTGLTYKPAPVWHSTAGYLGFVNTGATVEVDAGHHRPSVLSLGIDDEAIDLYLLGGAGPKELLGDYTVLTGRGRRPEAWTLGYWMGRCRYHGATEMLDVVDRMRELDVPIDVVHADPDWLVVDRLNTDFIWNTDRFGDLAEFTAALRERGVRLSIWEVPYLDPMSPRHVEAETAGHLLRSADGGLARLRGTPTPDGRDRSIVDMTDADAQAWWSGFHQDFLDAGVAVFKTDFGEGCPDDAHARDGTPSNHLHNLYPLKYNGTVHAAVEAHTGRPALVWGRSGWAGSQRYPGQWGGDAESTVAGLQATLRGGLSHALSTPGFWSHDIGGFFGPELTPGLYVRWTQFGALSPLMRAHGLRPREPWAFGDEAFEICLRWIRLRYSLLPYLWSVAGEVERLGLPMLRPLLLEHPDDPIAAGIDDEFLLGRELLVAPVLDDGMRTVRRRVYLPAGRWHRFDTGAQRATTLDEPIDGPAVRWIEAPIDEMPVFVRSGATIPRVAVDAGVRNVADLLGRPWTLHRYGPSSGDPDAVVADLDGFDGSPPVVAGVVDHR